LEVRNHGAPKFRWTFTAFPGIIRGLFATPQVCQLFMFHLSSAIHNCKFDRDISGSFLAFFVSIPKSLPPCTFFTTCWGSGRSCSRSGTFENAQKSQAEPDVGSLPHVEATTNAKLAVQSGPGPRRVFGGLCRRPLRS
jgi:hypothetical protein